MTGQEKLPRGGTIAVLALAGFLLAVWVFGPPAGTTADLANRLPEEAPPITAASLTDKSTFAQADKYLTDRVRAKPWAVGMVNRAVLAATGRSPTSQVVASGDDWFYEGEFTEPCPYLASVAQARQGLQNLRDAARQGGREVAFVVVPNKSTTLADRVPRPAQSLQDCSNRNRAELEALAREPDSPLLLVDPDRVREIAGEGAYWQQDTHWTTSGGRALTEEIARVVGGRPAASEALQRQEVTGEVYHLPDLRPLLGLDGTVRTPVYGPRRPPSFTEVPGPAPRPRTFTSPDPLAGAPSMAMVYDSFVYAPGLEPQIASLFPSGLLVQWDAIAALDQLPGQELVVLESTERLALGRLAGMNPDTALKPLLDYIARS